MVQKLSTAKLSDESEIWTTKAKDQDIAEAIEYATVSLPWTFDRLRYGVSTQKSMNQRLQNIMKGVLNQTLLERVLQAKGYSCSKNWKNYRDSDIFDFSINKRLYDVKTFHVIDKFTDETGRERFTTKLVVKNRSDDGPGWKTFFPMLVTYSQLSFKTRKDAYIFGISETYEDLRSTAGQWKNDGFWCAVPFRDSAQFFFNGQLIRTREENERGFNLGLKWRKTQSQLASSSQEKLRATAWGEWGGSKRSETLELAANEKAMSAKQFSSLTCIQFANPGLLTDDVVEVTASNQLKSPVPKLTDPTIDLNNADFIWEIEATSLINLRVPRDYKVHWIGHIPAKDFFERFKSYKCYFAVKPGTDENTAGRLHTGVKESFQARDRRREKHLEAGEEVVIPEFMPLVKGKRINAGLFMAVQTKAGRAIGASCYYYPPNFPFWESALYVLPQDLYVMDSLPK